MAKFGEPFTGLGQGVQNQVDQDRFKRNLFRKGVREARRKGDIGGAIKLLEDAEARSIAAGPGIHSQGLNQGNLRAQAEDAIQNQGVEAEGEARGAPQIRRGLGQAGDAGDAGDAGQELHPRDLLPEVGSTPGIAPPVTANVPQAAGQEWVPPLPGSSGSITPPSGPIIRERRIGFNNGREPGFARSLNPAPAPGVGNLGPARSMSAAGDALDLRKKKPGSRNLFAGGATRGQTRTRSL